MLCISEGRGDFLSKATHLGISFLSQNDFGFFIMIEGSQIDWAGHHANNANYLIQEVLDFDRAIGTALDFAEKDGSTLVIVTADHETGGFTLAAKEKKVFGKARQDYNQIKPTFSTTGHSATLVPVLTFGPGALNFSGIYPNNILHEKILEALK